MSIHLLSRKTTLAVVVVTGYCLAVAEGLASEPDDAVTVGTDSLSIPGSTGNPVTCRLSKADLAAWMDGFLPYALESGDIVGAVVTIVSDSEVLFNKGYGYADLASRRVVDPEQTVFRPGSISKLFVWTAIMQLVELGRIDLESSIAEYLDFDIEMPRGVITIRHLMTHTAGFEEVIRDVMPPAGSDSEALLRDLLADNVPAQVFPPGSTPAYSNYASALAGYIVERVSGDAFADYVTENIFEPLEMSSATFAQPVPEQFTERLSSGYRSLSDGTAKPFEIIALAPAGALSATGADIAKFMMAHLSGGRGVLAPQSLKLMHNSVDRHYPRINSMALGFYEQSRSGIRIIGHRGDTAYFHSNLALFPERGLGVFIAMNSAGKGPASFHIREELLNGLVRRYFPAADPAGKPLPTALEHGKALAGTYEVSRRSVTNAFAAPHLLNNVKATVNQNGELRFDLLPGINGAPLIWQETEPWVWKAKGREMRLAADVRDGKVVGIAVEPVSAIMVFTRPTWWRSSSFLLPALFVAVLTFFVIAFAWPIGALRRWRQKRTHPVTVAMASARRMQQWSSILILVFLLTWAAFFADSLQSLARAANNEGWLRFQYAMFPLPFVAVALCVRAAAAVWSESSPRRTKAKSALLIFAALTVVWYAKVGQLFSMDVSY